jgi:hypothetical protein
VPIFPGLAHVAITIGDRDLLIRRSPGTGELTYLRCYSAAPRAAVRARAVAG